MQKKGSKGVRGVRKGGWGRSREELRDILGRLCKPEDLSKKKKKKKGVGEKTHVGEDLEGGGGESTERSDVTIAGVAMT